MDFRRITVALVLAMVTVLAVTALRQPDRRQRPRLQGEKPVDVA